MMRTTECRQCNAPSLICSIAPPELLRVLSGECSSSVSQPLASSSCKRRITSTLR
jgi:hypothetical protein